MHFIKPEKTVDGFDIIPGMQIADFGCGSGHWTVELAKHTGPSGKVVAIDIVPEALEAARSRAKLHNMHNIDFVRADLEVPQASKLRDGLVDIVMLSNILAQTEDKEIVIKEAYRILKPGGRAIVVEWDATEQGAEHHLRPSVPRKTIEDAMQKAAFSFIKECNAGSYHYGLIFRK